MSHLLLLSRRGEFSPKQIAGLQLWLKADSLALNDGDPVGTWADQSGNGRDFTQATASLKPTYKANILNGKPVVRFDGVDDLLTAAAAVMTVTSDWSLVAVLKPISAVADRAPVMNGSASGYGIGTSTGATAKKGWIAGGVSWQDSTTAADTNANVWVVSRVSGGGTTTLHVNGTALTVADAAATTPTASRLGSHAAGSEWNGDMAEVLMYTPKLTDANRDLLESYLGSKYGITVV